jgi:hypothetical protein
MLRFLVKVVLSIMISSESAPLNVRIDDQRL